jgi:hypothetical protein
MSCIHSALFVKMGGFDELMADMSEFMYRPLPILPVSADSTEKMASILPVSETEPPEVKNTFIPIVSAPPEVKMTPYTKESIPIPTPKVKPSPPPPSPKLFFSNKEDTLFWAIYIQVYGYAAYLEIGVKYKNVEMEEKRKIMVHLKANTNTYKTGTTHKLTGVEIQEIMSDLMTCRKTNLLSVYALSIYYNLSICLVKDLLYHEFLVHSATESVVIYYTHGRYGLYLTENAPVFDKNACFRLDGIYKPLRGVGSYKVADLETIFEKVVRPTLSNEDMTAFKKMKKGDLYDAILQKCLW